MDEAGELKIDTQSVLLVNEGDAIHLGALVARVAAKDQSALKELRILQRVRLYRIARRVLRSQECAEEIVEDVFLHVWKHAHTYDSGRGPVAAWLTVATKSRAIDRWRSSRTYDGARAKLTAVEPFLYSEQTEDKANDVRLRASLSAAMSTLSPMRQQLLGLAYFEGLTHAQIARHRGMPLGTVKSNVRRALTSMRAVLQDEVRASNGRTPLTA